MSQHTPEPWTLSGEDPEGLTVVSGNGQYLIARAAGTVGLAQAQANARLIEQAPAMFELLLRAHGQAYFEKYEERERVLAVIDRVYGKGGDART